MHSKVSAIPMARYITKLVLSSSKEGKQSSKANQSPLSWASVIAATALSLCSHYSQLLEKKKKRESNWGERRPWDLLCFLCHLWLFSRKPQLSGSKLPVSFIFIPFHSYSTGFCRAVGWRESIDAWEGKSCAVCCVDDRCKRGWILVLLTRKMPLAAICVWG